MRDPQFKETTFLSNLNDLASANPNQPATNGVVLLVRAELKSEIRSEVGSLRTEMNQRFSEVNQRFEMMDQKFEEMNRKLDDVKQTVSGLKNSVELIAQQMATLLLKN